MPRRPRPTSPTSPPAGFAERLEAAKAARWAQVLFKCARLLNERALEEVRRRTGHDVRPSHTALFPHIDLEGTRPSALAQKLGVSKQAVGQTVDELVHMGLLERAPDPKDARAQLVRFSAAGREGLMTGLTLLQEIEQALAAEVGAQEVAQMHRTLGRLLQVLQSGAPLPPRKKTP